MPYLLHVSGLPEQCRMLASTNCYQTNKSQPICARSSQLCLKAVSSAVAALTRQQLSTTMRLHLIQTGHIAKTLAHTSIPQSPRQILRRMFVIMTCQYTNRILHRKCWTLHSCFGGRKILLKAWNRYTRKICQS